MTQTAAAPADRPPNPARRTFLYGGAAVAAAVAGAGVAWWRFRPRVADPGALATLWASTFDDPAGKAMPMAAFRGKPLLVNFWATWCPPCVEELPLIDAFFRQNSQKGWQVLGLAIDQPSAVRSFLGRTPVSFPIGMAGLEGSALVKSLGNEAGGLPFTVVVSAEGAVLHRRMGRLTATDLAEWAKPA